MNIKQGHVVVITGAGGGVGTELAHQLADKGCALALADISPEALEKTASSLPASVGKVTCHAVDVTDKKAMQKFAEEVVAEHGGVNIVINSAGITLQKNFSTHSIEDWERIVGINWWGVLYSCHYFDKALTEAKDAHVVNLSSMSSFIGLPAQSSYCATKAGVQMLSECMWAEWKQKGIGVTSVHPGAIRTDMILATVEESDDVEKARKNFELAHKTGVDVDFAARKIIRAIEKDKKRIKIGRDSRIVHFIARYMPWLGDFLMRKIAEKQANS